MRVLIVGAGIAGLATAKALELNGMEPEIVERHDTSPTSGQGIFLLGNATRALAALGLLEQISQSAFKITAQRILSSRGIVLNDVSTQSVWKDCGPCLALPRQTLIDVIKSSLATTTVRYGTTVKTTTPRPNGREVVFSDGRVSSYDLVVGADGIRSPLRAATFPEPALRSLDMACWRFVVDNRGEVDAWTAMLGKKRTLLGIPLSGSKLYIYADCSLRDFADGSLTVLKGLFANFDAPLGSIIADLDESTALHRSNLEEVLARRYVAERLVLIGDAAHACSPNMAQGAGMAIEDALVLANLLDASGPSEPSLNEFHERRMTRVAWVQQQCRARDKLRGSSDLVRNLVLRHFGTALYKRSYRPLTHPL